jgi:hypothetical protein
MRTNQGTEDVRLDAMGTDREEHIGSIVVDLEDGTIMQIRHHLQKIHRETPHNELQLEEKDVSLRVT